MLPPRITAIPQPGGLGPSPLTLLFEEGFRNVGVSGCNEFRDVLADEYNIEVTSMTVRNWYNNVFRPPDYMRYIIADALRVDRVRFLQACAESCPIPVRFR